MDRVGVAMSPGHVSVRVDYVDATTVEGMLYG
jgi:hypothetical protein